MLQVKLIGLLFIGLVIAGLTAGLYYYKSEATAARDKVAVLAAEQATLKKHIKDEAKRVSEYVADNADLAQHSHEIAVELQKARAKLAKHNLLKLRNSAHSELVLKIINRSVEKQNKEWMK